MTKQDIIFLEMWAMYIDRKRRDEILDEIAEIGEDIGAHPESEEQ